MRNALIICVYKRHDLERIVIENFKRQSQIFGFDVVIVGSEGVLSKQLAEGCHYVESENFPISNKHNKGLEKAKELNAKGVVLMGSDDLVSDSYFEFIEQFSEQTSELIGLKDLYFYSTKTKKLGYWKGYTSTSTTVGAGRYFSRAILEQMNWQLWSDKKNKGLDTDCLKRLTKKGITERIFTMEESNVFLVDIKHSRSITDKCIIDVCKPVNSDIMAKRVVKKAVEQIKALEPQQEVKVTFEAGSIYDLLSNGNPFLGAKDTLVKGVSGVDAEILVNKGFARLA